MPVYLRLTVVAHAGPVNVVDLVMTDGELCEEDFD